LGTKIYLKADKNEKGILLNFMNLRVLLEGEEEEFDDNYF
jgi:hypothetical protein